MKLWIHTHRARLFVGLCIVHTWLLGMSAVVHTPDANEIGHMGAGLTHWRTGRFHLYVVNPPLLRMISVLPVLACNYQLEQDRDFQPYQRGEFPVGAFFVADNTWRTLTMFTLARWASIPFSLLGAYVCYRWANELYGPPAGLLPAALWCFSPLVLAFGATIMPDVGTASFGVVAAYALWRWLREPTWDIVLGVGLALGLAQLTRMLWIFLYVLWPVLWLVARLVGRGTGQAHGPLRVRTMVREGLQLAAILGLSVLIINMAYGFEGTGRRLGAFAFHSRALGGAGRYGHSGNRFAQSWLGGVPMPLPANYVLGFDVQKVDFEYDGWCYLRGQWRKGGCWYYYLYGLLVKVPAGIWLLAAGSLVCRGPHGRRLPSMDEWVVWAPALGVLALVSWQGTFNQHVRYVLPALPAVLIATGRAAAAAWNGRWVVRGMVIACAVWGVASSLLVWPHSLAYFNELAGGPRAGYRHLGLMPTDTNLDCGQDLLFLRMWLDKHPEVKGLRTALVQFVMPETLSIPQRRPPPGQVSDLVNDRWDNMMPSWVAVAPQDYGPEPGWYALSVSAIWNPRDEFAYFRELEPVARIGYTINIYYIDVATANQLRRKLGLPELSSGRKRRSQ